jgi:hypothetical protein
MELQQVVFRPDFQPLAKLRNCDSEKGGKIRTIAGVDQIHRTGKAFAVG